MGAKSKIEWTDATWNPITGCTKISPGCAHCYAERMARRLQAMGNPKYRQGFDVTVQQPYYHDQSEIQFTWKKPKNIFVCSMGDLFHDQVSDRDIHRIFRIMNDANWHRFQVLTKRSERLLHLSPELNWTPNIWMGVSVENQDYTYRISQLLQTGAKVKFVSFEPLLGPIDYDLSGLDWVIVGGESGPGARPLKVEWVESIQTQCLNKKVPFFFKQWGEFKPFFIGGKRSYEEYEYHRVGKKKAGRMLDGRTWDEMPRMI